MNSHPNRYHGALVALLWLLAVLLIVARAMGTFALKPVLNSSRAPYHQFVRRDGLLARMGFGARSVT